jgi:hypothetical protein
MRIVDAFVCERLLRALCGLRFPGIKDPALSTGLQSVVVSAGLLSQGTPYQNAQASELR